MLIDFHYGIQQVYSFVKLAGLYYAGSHGMDIKGPSKTCKYKKVRTSVPFCNLIYCTLFFFFLLCFVFLSLAASNFFFTVNSCVIQGNQGVLFQPASEFLPMIDEVCCLPPSS